MVIRGHTHSSDVIRDIDEPFHQGANAEHAPLDPGVLSSGQNTHQTRGLTKTSGDVTKLLLDTVTRSPATSSDVEPVLNTIAVQSSAPVQSIGNSISSVTEESKFPFAPEQLYADSDPQACDDAGQPSSVRRASEAETYTDTTPSRLPANMVGQSDWQDHSSTSITATSFVNCQENALTGAVFRLYLDGETHLLDPQGCVTLTGLTTRDESFAMMTEDLQDEIGADDRIVAVKIRRADGDVFKGLDVRTMPIKRNGQQDMWKKIIDTLSEHAAGENGLRGYVQVKKRVDAN
jgi:hypothetical protein